MTVQRYTSRQFQFRRVLLERLAGAPWPQVAAFDGDHAPTIGWSGEDAEYITVERVASNTPTVALGPTMRDERITATIVIFSEIPGFDEATAFDRVERLADVLQELFFDSSGPFPEPVAFGLDGEYLSAEIERVETFSAPAPEGMAVRCEIDVSVSADI